MEVEEMRKCLKHEGWEEDSLLPLGWRMRKSENYSNGVLDVDYTLMSKEGEIYNSLKTAVEFMESTDKYSDEDIVQIRTLYENESKQNRQQKYDWAEDPTVPSGWKTRTVDGKMNKKFFLAPDGSSFACRRSGLQHMIKEKFLEKEVNIMREMLVHEGWETDEALPFNWKIRKSEGTTNGITDVDYWFLSPEGHLFRSTKSAVEFMTENPLYNDADIIKITTKLEAERKVVRQQKYDWIEGDETVPPNWKVRVIEGKTRKTFFLSEDGNQFACRRSALQHMIKENYPESEIMVMREKLAYEGWEDDDLLPQGWKVRKSEGSTNGVFDVNYYYLSSDGTMFHSTRAVITYMKNRQDYNQSDIEKIKTRLENETKKNRPQKYDWLEDAMLPPGWKFRTIIKGGIRTDFILTSEGGQHQSRRAAIESMIKDDFDPQAIFRMWSTLDVEGWVTDDDRLPKGWRVRSKDRLKDNWQFYFLSPQMEIFKSNKSVLDYISSQPEVYSSEDYNKVKQWIEEEQKARRGENYTWNDDASLPKGWKMRTVVTNSNNIREFFLTPEGDHVAGRKKAIEIMKETGSYSKGVIDKMTRKMKQVSDKNSSKKPADRGWGPGASPPRIEDDWSIGQAASNSMSLEISGSPTTANADWHNPQYEEENSLVYSNSSDDENDVVYHESIVDTSLANNSSVEVVDESNNTIDMKGFIPEFEPVEITPVKYTDNNSNIDDDDSEDDDEFNDAEEITDEMLDPPQKDLDAPVIENIKIEPEIDYGMLNHQWNVEVSHS